MKTLLIKRAPESPIRAFYKYLTQNDIYEIYFEHAKEHIANNHYYDDMTDFFEKLLPNKWIIWAFEWHANEGFEFWRKYHQKWSGICEKYNYNQRIKLS